MNPAVFPSLRPRGILAGFFAAALWPLGLQPAQAADGIENAAGRAALPEFRTIPAATPAELTPAAAVDPKSFTTWTRSQGDEGARRYSALTQIDRTNVSRLTAAWTYHSGDGSRNIQCTPIVVDGVMYAPTAGRAMVALDAATGAELWRYQVEQPKHPGLEDEPARRGLIYWPGDASSPARILFGSGNWIYALDPKAGHPLAEFGDGGRASIPTGATVGGAIYRGVFVTAGLYGDIFGYDVRTGRQLWRFHTVPGVDEPGGDTWNGPDRGHADCWGGLSIDEDRGMVLAAIGAPQTNFIGVGRLGTDLYGDCVLALDALTGRRLWYFQNLHHDIWDLDNSAAPNLVTITRDGKKVDAVTCVSKAGILMLLDRMTGKPIFPLRERRAPVSILPGERTEPYQPDPELPEKISDMEFHLDEVTNRTPAAHDFVLKQVQRATYGWFQPFVAGKPNLFMGTRGGGEWSGAAVDLPTGRLYVSSNHIPSKVTVFASDEGPRDPAFPASAGEKLYLQNCAVCHGPDRAGQGMIPPLVGLQNRMDDAAVLAILKTGRNAMPPAPQLNEAQKRDLLDYLFRRNQPPQRKVKGNAKKPYAYDGYNFLTDQDGYPGIKPPWGLLNCYDLNTGRILWRVPLGEYPELIKAGVPITGAQNLGGATVTAGGLVFCAGTADQLIRAFDADTGKELWRAKLPWAGYAAPAVYEVHGREYVVITATGGGKVGGPTGDAYVAFALPKLPPPSRPAITGIAHLVVLNDDLEASRHFYGDLIGWPVSPPMGRGTALHFQVGLKQYLEVKVAPAKIPPDRVSLIAFETADVSALREYLAAKGVAVPAAVEVHANGARSIEVRDPDGNAVEFTSGGAFPPPATAPQALSTHLIHIGFDIHDLPAQTHFWQDVLGFRLYWHGWQKDAGHVAGQDDYRSLQVPNGTDWIEFMITKGPKYHHFSPGVVSVEAVYAEAQRRDAAAAAKTHTHPGRDGKGQLNLFDPNHIRVEFMNFEPDRKPDCAPFTGPQPHPEP